MTLHLTPSRCEALQGDIKIFKTGNIEKCFGVASKSTKFGSPLFKEKLVHERNEQKDPMELEVGKAAAQVPHRVVNVATSLNPNLLSAYSVVR